MTRTIVTGLGRSGTKWISEFLDVPHEATANQNLLFKVHNNFVVNRDIIDAILIKEDGYCEVNSYYRFSIDDLMRLDISTYVIIRNPVDTIESWMNCGVIDRLYKYNLNDYTNLYFYELNELTQLCLWWNYQIKKIKKSRAIAVFSFDNIVKNESYANIFYNKVLNKSFDERKDWYLENNNNKVNETKNHDVVLTDLERHFISKNCNKLYSMLNVEKVT